jgi:spermidine synthase
VAVIEEPRSRSAQLPVGALLAFFLSGAAALIYQVLWTRRLGLVFGVTVHAASIVLACFMAGLAIGSLVAGRRAERLAKPLRAFALVELGVGVAGLLTPVALEGVESLFVHLAQWWPGNLLWANACRFVLSAVVLVVPSTLMGATYPLMLQATVRATAHLRTNASLLYGINTTGAIVGVITASLWLVPTIGLTRSFLVAAALNGLVAILALAMRPIALAVPTARPPQPVESTVTTPISASARLAILVVIALSGAVSLALEIVWFRVLVFFLRPTTYAFASMLATVLFGLALGSLVATPLVNRRANWLFVLGALEVAIGLSALVSAFTMVRSLDVMEWAFTFTWLSPPLDFVVPLALAASVAIVPTAALLGAAFPLGLSLWTEAAKRDDATAVGRPVGVLYAANVAGAIVGSLVAGFLLVPSLGAQGSLVVVSALPVIGGVVLVHLSGVGARHAFGGMAIVALVVLGATLPDVLHDVIVRRYARHDVHWHREDAQATVTVVSRGGGPRTLLIDGMHHASEGRDMVRGHERIGAMGLALHPNPRRALVVGFGGGTTSGAVSVAPGLLTDVVELSPSVLLAGPLFEGSNRRVNRNPRVRFHVGDGRNFLATTTDRFDIITADLLLPEMAGAANLYSADYYQLARGALAPGGLMVQWIPADNDYRYRMMLRSFMAAFPHVTLWGDGSIAVGSSEPIRFHREAFERQLAHPAVASVMGDVGLARADDVLAAYLGSKREAEAYVGAGPTLVDDRPVIEYFLSMPTGVPPADTARMRGPVSAILP